MKDAPGEEKAAGQEKAKSDWKTPGIAGVSAVIAAALVGVHQLQCRQSD
ncbi:hypothetical protein J7E83_11825 [Arthrobacter sp. ISL-48]|nr:hypothetical protein [Arthrobacter sp. ISL-48]MBT2532798.1 hypothetical protein [Arthrobacter sp. ISL-48]